MWPRVTLFLCALVFMTAFWTVVIRSIYCGCLWLPITSYAEQNVIMAYFVIVLIAINVIVERDDDDHY